MSFQKAIEKRFADELKQHGGDERRVTFDLTPGPKPQIAAFVNRINAHSAHQSIHGMIKKYYGEYDGNIQINYEENEWRYLVEDTESTPWFWDKAGYDEWRGNRSTTHKPKPNEALIREKLRFTAQDVAFIIVSKEVEISHMVNFISRMERIANTEISEGDKLMLYTRIISLERIQKDF